jgi:transketolase
VLADCEGEPELILIATGSEVQLALGAHETLSGEGIRSRVVSLPCWEIFDRQDAEYRDEVLPPGPAVRVAIEEASTLGWERYVGSDGTIVGMHTFGQSAPFKDVEEEFGFTPDKIAAVAREAVERGGKAKAGAMEEER